MIDIILDWDTKIREDFLDYFNIPEYNTLSKDELLMNYFNKFDKLMTQNKKTVKFSNEIKNSQYYIDYFQIIDRIKRDFEEANIIKLNNCLSKKSIIAHEQDLLLNNWGIHHFHLGENIQNDFYQRTNNLLFVKVESDSVYFLDIKDHDNFSSIDFLKIIHNNWSHIIKQYKVDNMIDIQPKPNETEIMQLWKIGVQIAVTFTDTNNKEVAYMPIGGGTTINNQSLDNALLLTKINRDCCNIEDFLKKNKNEIQIIIENNIKIDNNIIKFYLRFDTENNYFYLTESKSGLAFSWNNDKLIQIEQ